MKSPKTNSSKTCYITTPIYYPNDKLHLGHAYTNVLADTLARYKKALGYDVMFLTGSDEHGKKIQLQAMKKGIDPKVFLDNQIASFKNLWLKLNINYSQFIRTSNLAHIRQVQTIFSYLIKKQFIYKGFYKGIYCNFCSEFLVANQLSAEKNCKNCLNKPVYLSEETYFFKLQDQIKFLKSLYAQPNSWLVPLVRVKELQTNFLNNELLDFSVARKNVDWGIKVKEDNSFVVYVWFDALCNYISALNYCDKKQNLMAKYWGPDTEIIQFIGKEITRFHAIYWPILLRCLGLRLPNKLIAHGWIIMGTHKMSKSLQNVVDPFILINRYSSDAVRLFLNCATSMANDLHYSHQLFLNFYNAYLVNNLSNLMTRVTAMVEKYYQGQLPSDIKIGNSDLFKNSIQYFKQFLQHMDNAHIYDAYQTAFKLADFANKYIEVHEPWKLKTENPAALAVVVVSLVHCLAILNFCFGPAMPDATSRWNQILGIKHPLAVVGLLDPGLFNNHRFTIKKSLILFQRLVIADELDFLSQANN